MLESLNPEQFTLSTEDGAPFITLHRVTVSNVHGWSVLSRRTVIVVDGPEDEGFLLPRMTGPDVDLAPENWDVAVSSATSVGVLVSGTQIAATVID
ncbi:hypothetical protein [Nocardioides aurantiacus]|uniref:hypothetical protein n=1 Tax=Nocardioides aurantiacus TaxID=86796 RepID=UPI00403F92EA